MGKIYKFIKDQLRNSIQSDTEQTASAEKLWTKLSPMIFDTNTEMIIDPKEFDLTKRYSNFPRSEKYRYTWIIHESDHYPSQNILREHSLMMPLKGLWKV